MQLSRFRNLTTFLIVYFSIFHYSISETGDDVKGSGVTVFGGYHPLLGSLVMKHGGHTDLIELVSLAKIEREMSVRSNWKIDRLKKKLDWQHKQQQQKQQPQQQQIQQQQQQEYPHHER